ncbi:MAG: ABC transporter substrate-binding protein [Desulfobacterales bacterium]|nr:MAG: ABC transporter substrate-binding protein [Desulfobacterales bacterium]
MKLFRGYTKYAIALLAIFVFVPCASLLAAESITVTSFGGAFSTSQIEAYQKPFAKKTGVTVNAEVYNGGLAEIRAQVQSGNVTWDVVDVEKQDLTGGCDEGLFEPVDPAILSPAPDGTPATEDFLPGTIHECGVATIIWTTIVAYDKTKFPGEKPSKLADFFDVKKFPGMRGISKRVVVALEMALMADGVPPADVYKVLSTPEGVDRAFKKLDTIKANLIFWDAGAQPPQMLADGEVVMTTAYNGRIFNAQVAENKPFEIIWDHHVWNTDSYAIVKGTKHKATALEFLKFATSTQALADQASWIAYGPSRKSSVPLITTYHGTDIQMASHMPTAPQNFTNALLTDDAFWADHQDELQMRYSGWMAK